MNTLRVGVIGLGVGEQHLRTYNSIEGVEVVAICDQDPNKLKAIQESYLVDHAYSDYQKITESSDIDIVSICSYDDCHAEHCISETTSLYGPSLYFFPIVVLALYLFELQFGQLKFISFCIKNYREIFLSLIDV